MADRSVTHLTGAGLSMEVLASAVRPGATIRLSPEGLSRMATGRDKIDAAVAEGRAIYGVTTGLGSRATEALPEAQLAAFSVETLNGRAQTVGETLPVETVRAAMLVRLNTFLLGASGAHPSVARHLAAVFNAGLTPQVRAVGSIGAADLLHNAEIGRAAFGLGGHLNDEPSAQALADAGLPPPNLGPRDGLALANHASLSTAEAAMACLLADRCLAAARPMLSLSLLGFQANVTPLEPAVLALKGHATDMAIAADVLARLDGAAIRDPDSARRLQDPISLRNAIQTLGAADMMATPTRTAVAVELNGSSDNPAVLIQDDRILSTGNYFTAHLAAACDGLTRALAGVGAITVARLSKLCAARLTDLPAYLADPEHGTNGFAPLLKLAEAVLADLYHAATPVLPWPSVNADGVEDGLTLSFQAARRLRAASDRLATLLALEGIMAAQAMDSRGVAPTESLSPAYARIRERCSYVSESRPLGASIEALRDDILAGHDL
jgi:histidine ammonia-lyase